MHIVCNTCMYIGTIQQKSFLTSSAQLSFPTNLDESLLCSIHTQYKFYPMVANPIHPVHNKKPMLLPDVIAIIKMWKCQAWKPMMSHSDLHSKNIAVHVLCIHVYNTHMSRLSMISLLTILGLLDHYKYCISLISILWVPQIH